MTPLTREWRPAWPVDIAVTWGPLRRGTGDPTFRMERRVGGAVSVWRVQLTPDGAVSLHVQVDAARACVEATAWGPGAKWVLDYLPRALGADDDCAGFDPQHAVIADSWRRHPGWRVPATGLVFESLVPAILEQKVTSVEARRSYRELLLLRGEPAPGPAPEGMRVPLSPQMWAQIPSWDWHRCGVGPQRSATVIQAARVAGRLEEAATLPWPEASRRLQAVRGVGVWTAAEVAQRALGDPDSVSVGDYHLATLVGHALTGASTDDEGMLSLLSPYAGHRFRAVRCIELSGVRTPRKAPRMAPRDYRRI